jgi:hypothetical protein
MIKISINKSDKKGIITAYLLVFVGIFFLMFGGLLNFILSQFKLSSEKIAFQESLNVAEAGANYYHWCINNNLEQDCLAEKDYFDPAGNLVGHFSLQSSSTFSCGQNIQKNIVSTGWTDRFPNVKRKIEILYARASVAKFSYILDNNVWVGSSQEIEGPYESNGGVRFDGTNESTVTSATDEWVCTSSFGCSPCPTGNGCHIASSTCMCPGVFTTTGNSDPTLFGYPIPPFNFTGLTIDLAEMKEVAQTSGVYLPPSATINSLGKGYHIKFKSDGNFEAWIITGLSTTSAYSLEEDWHYDAFTITNEYLLGTYSVPLACSAIFVEDNIWPEGTVKGKIAIASADFIDPNRETDAVLIGNINYTATSGADSFALISERNILVGPQSPDDMTLRGIFVAQTGRFGRNHYTNNYKDQLDVYGAVVSKGRVGTQWTSGGHIISGYTDRKTHFDSNLIYNPPSFVPYVESDFKMIDWQELK